MYREWKKIEFPKGYYIWIWEQQDWETDQEIDGKMRWERMEEWLMEKGGREKYITERNGKSTWERQGIVPFCTCQRNEWILKYTCEDVKQWTWNFRWGGVVVNCARNTLRILGVWCVCCEMLTDPVFYRLWWKPESQGTSEWYPVNANPSRLFGLDGRTNNINHVAAVSLFTNKSPHQSVNINTGC